ncbi:hypothetical protein DIPPA_11302 [Diplonema papillatum]|nr:hypothetical protein DIPPA_11302 [Diplonema papillatum]
MPQAVAERQRPPAPLRATLQRALALASETARVGEQLRDSCKQLQGSRRVAAGGRAGIGAGYLAPSAHLSPPRQTRSSTPPPRSPGQRNFSPPRRQHEQTIPPYHQPQRTGSSQRASTQEGFSRYSIRLHARAKFSRESRWLAASPKNAP